MRTLTEKRSGEQTGEQRNEGGADQNDAAASHELLDTLRLGAGVVVSVALQQVNGSPDAETCAKGNYQSLKNADSRVEKFHICVAGIIGCWLN